MFNPSLQSLVAQAHVDELHRVAQTHNLHGAFAAPTHQVDRRKATQLNAGVKRVIGRILGGARGATEASAAIHRLELLGDSSATTTGPRPHHT
jgi:hypothetical protein